jgi:hydroxymethylpyrimidine/phosphomethylpyrimidine kinase
VSRFCAPRVATINTHGTGCTLSSAIAAHLAQGLALEAAIRAAKDYLTEALRAGDRLDVGHGHGPVHHFARLWPQ